MEYHLELQGPPSFVIFFGEHVTIRWIQKQFYLIIIALPPNVVIGATLVMSLSFMPSVIVIFPHLFGSNT